MREKPIARGRTGHAPVNRRSPVPPPDGGSLAPVATGTDAAAAGDGDIGQRPLQRCSHPSDQATRRRFIAALAEPEGNGAHPMEQLLRAASEAMAIEEQGGVVGRPS